VQGAGVDPMVAVSVGQSGVPAKGGYVALLDE